MNWYIKSSQDTVSDSDRVYFEYLITEPPLAKSLVDATAKKAGYVHMVYKGYRPYGGISKSHAKINIFKRPEDFPAFHKDELDIPGIAGFFTNDLNVASFFRFKDGTIGQFYLKIDHPFVIDAKGDFAGNLQFGKSGIPFREALRSGEYDCVIINNTQDEGDVYVMMDSTKIKSSEVETKDDSGETIPLSKRFDSGNPDFRY